jgi:protein involved in polysaccharide export with SLBB domain
MITSLATILAGMNAPPQYQAKLNAFRSTLSQAGARSAQASSSQAAGSKQPESQPPPSQQQAQAPFLVPLPFEPLRQFGYTLFECPSLTFIPLDEVPVGPDYVLGPGDSLLINLWGGMMDNSITQVVNRNGEILLPKVGPVRVWGLTFAQAERVVRAQLSRYFRGFQTGLTLGKLRIIKVYMVGDVTRPGSYTMSGLAALTNALTAGTGPSKLGSLRGIKLLRNGHTVGTLDLYDFMLKGNRAQDFRLESGDTIFIPPIGPVAAVAGEVKRPAIYELKGPTKITDLIEMAGGLTPMAYLKRVQILRAVPGRERTVVDVDVTNGPSGVEIQDGDVVKVLAINSRVYNIVTLEGAVNHPGTRELKPGMRVSQLLTKAEVVPEAYLDRVEVERKLQDNKNEVLELNLRKLWSGDETQDLPLSPQDRITVRTDVRPPASVTLSGEVKRPGIYRVTSGERLGSVLKRAGGFTEKAYLRGALFTRQSAKRIEKEQIDKFVQAQEAKLLAEAGTLVVSGVDREEVGVQSQTINARRELLNVLASRVALGRVVIKLDDIEKLEGSPSDLWLEDGDSLYIPTPPSSVAIVGAVRNPTSVVYQEGADAEYYLNRAGGLTPEADRKGFYIQKADGSAVTGFSKLRKVEVGDALIIPPKAETQYRPVSIARDMITVFSQTLLSIASLAALVVLVP